MTYVPVGDGSVPNTPDDNIRILEDWKAHNAADAMFQGKLFELAASSVDRAKSAAQVIQTSAAAIATVYSGVLAVSFSTDSQRLPSTGILAPLFLGTAVSLATVYVAYMTSGHLHDAHDEATTVASTGDTNAVEGLAQQQPDDAFGRSTDFAEYARIVSSLVGRRLWALQSAVVALFIGLLAVAVPFVDFAPNPGATRSAESPVDWPIPDPALSAPLQEIRYQAEVDLALEEARSAGTKDRESPFTDTFGFTALLAAGGLVIVFLGPYVLRRVTGRR